ncbi:NAD(P)/FAD-dependent oxidoreductase [Leifsonia xyli]|uniref:NAD(P)/FAD-dependent oxidoreductase n=1 Tax=Leifsonia xyli TaxID=1575 RepID=UPI003D667111
MRSDGRLLDRALLGAARVPYWLDSAARPPASSALTGDLQADLAVVGGGYCGLWTALLAKTEDPSREVVVVEAQTSGWAASGRNGGFVESTLTHGNENGYRHFPAEMETLDRLGTENFEAFAADLHRFGIDAEYERTGMLTVATEHYQVDELKNAAGSAGRFLDSAELESYVRSPLFRAGLMESHGVALVNPAKLVWGLRAACLDRGVRIFENTRATRLRDNGQHVTIETANASITARRVVLATNGFRSLLARNRLRTVPVYDYALMTEPLTDQQLAEVGWTQRFGMTDSSRRFHYYRKSKDNRILWGGFDAVYHRGGRIEPRHDHRDETYRRLADHFLRTFPQLADIRFTHAWGGMIDMSSRLVAFHGTALGGKVAYSSGFTGLGVAATRFAATVMLDLLAGRDTERTRSALVRTGPLPIPPEPLATPAIGIMQHAIARSERNQGREGLLLRAANVLGFSFDS